MKYESVLLTGSFYSIISTSTVVSNKWNNLTCCSTTTIGSLFENTSASTKFRALIPSSTFFDFKRKMPYIIPNMNRFFGFFVFGGFDGFWWFCGFRFLRFGRLSYTFEPSGHLSCTFFGTLPVNLLVITLSVYYKCRIKMLEWKS